MEEYIIEQGSVSLDSLCEKFQVSKNTVRRDVAMLVETGNFKKVYGGVLSTQQNTLLPFENRDETNPSHKEMICRYAAQLIRPNHIIFMDSGTTTRYLLRHLPLDIPLTILTNNLSIINEAVEYPNIRLLVLGNLLKHDTRSLVDVLDWSYYSKMNIDLAFMAATGISLERGASNSDLREYEIKIHMVKQSEQVILLIDQSKFSKNALVSYASMEEFQHIITCPQAPKEYRDYCKAKQIILTEVQD